MKKLIIFIIVCLLSLPALAEGPAKYEHSSTGTTITFPNDWKVSVTGVQILAVAPDKSISVVVQGLGKMDITAASKKVKSWVGASYKNLRTANAGWSTLGGMKIYFFRYSGNFNGTLLEGIATLADGPKGLAFILTSSLQTKAASHRLVIKEIFKSFGKL